jgi:putative heme iron utilization protein
MSNKMTLKDYYAELRVIAEENGREDLMAFIDGRVALIEKKNASKGESKVQKANAKYAEMVVDVLAENEKMTCTDICKALPKVEDMPNGWSTQKVTALLTPMVKDGSVVKTVSKGKSYYALA